MTNITSNGKAVTTKKLFSRETGVSIDIQTEPGVIWGLLTNAAEFPKWNSTIISIEGSIAAGNMIQLKSKLDPKRVFKLRIKEFEPAKRLVWGDSMGTRVYTLKSIGNRTTNFTMTEKIGGPLFPLFGKMIPPFEQSFEQFAKDLKRAAEITSKPKKPNKARK